VWTAALAASSAVAQDGSGAADPARDAVDWLVAGAQVLGIGAAAIAAFMAYRQLRENAEQARTQRSLAFLQRYSEGKEFRTLTGPVSNYLKATGPAECVTRIQAWQTVKDGQTDGLPAGSGTISRNGVRLLLDFFEELGAAYNQRLLQTDVLSRTIGPLPASLLAEGWWFFLWRRHDSGSDRTYRELEVMARDLRRHRADLRR
jgi:hypothetical protein